jgi:hypothetical protein
MNDIAKLLVVGAIAYVGFKWMKKKKKPQKQTKLTGEMARHVAYCEYLMDRDKIEEFEKEMKRLEGLKLNGGQRARLYEIKAILARIKKLRDEIERGRA